MKQNRLAASLFSVVVTLTVLSGAAMPACAIHHPAPSPSPPPPPSLCDLYPIALHAVTVAGVKPGDVVPDVRNGTRPGNFGWLTWNGDLGTRTLASSLTPPGDSGRYVNPDDPADHDVSVGDLVPGRPGAVNAAVCKALDRLKKLDSALVPLWDETREAGGKTAYRVSGFARVQLVKYRLNANARITVRFLGMGECGPPANGPPQATDAAAETPEDAAKDLALSGSDPERNPIRFAVVSGPSHGSLGPVAGDRVTYTPVRDYNGPDSFTFRANDGAHDSSVATFRLTVTPVNDAPVCRDISVETPVETPVETNPDGSDVDGDALTYEIVSQGSKGTASVVGGRLRYGPAAGETGADTFRYRARDGQAASNDAAVTVSIGPRAGRPPVARDDAAETAEDTAKTLTLPATDGDGDALTFSVVTGPSHGSLGAITGNQVVYTPSKDYFGSDSLTFRASDGHEQSAPAAVAITVTEVNDPPAAAADQFAVGMAEATSIPTTFVLSNDTAGPTNESGQPLVVSAVSRTPNTHGVVSVAGDVITYKPDPGFAGTATIGYTVCDKGTTHGRPDPRCASDGRVTLTVVASDRPPTANAQELETAEDTTLPVTLTGSDPDADPLRFEVVDPPAHGTLAGAAPAQAYVPEADYNGRDEFTFRTSDGRLRSGPAKVSLSITEVNDPPLPGEDNATLGGAGTLPPLPPRPNCGKPCGVIYGDPHLSSFDIAPYDFQAVGEFIAADSTTDDFEVQVRMAPVRPLRTVSIATAVAVNVAGHRVGVYRTLTGYDVKVDGVPFTVTAHPRALPGGGTIGTYGRDNEAIVVWPDGSRAIIAAVGLYREYYRFTVELGLAAGRLTRMVGLLGNADGEKANDVVTRDGVQLPWPNPPFNQLYPRYADLWRISQAESLFDYGPGETTETFTDRSYPDAPANVGTLPPNVAAAARAQCGLFGVTAPEMLDACTVDVGLTGDAEFASSSAAAQEAAHGIPNNTGVTAIGGSATVTIATAGQSAVRTFTATAGQNVTLSVSDNTIAGVDIAIRQPNGSPAGRLFLSGPSAFLDGVALAVTGTYTITVDPRDQNAGSLTFRMELVPENAGATAIGQATAITAGTVGENPVRTFTATAGQKIELFVGDNTIAGVDLTIRQPSGAIVGRIFVSGPSAVLDAITLQVTGTYTITIDPRDQNTGSLTFRMELVPENTGATAIGQATDITVGRAGENAVRTFTAAAGQNITLFVSDNTIAGVDLTIRQPNGGIVGRIFVSGPGAFLDAITLPVTGSYTITVDPRDQNTGRLTFRMELVPEATGATAIGQATDITVGTVGENAVRTFTATAGQNITLFVSNNTIAGVDLTIRQPNGAIVGRLFASGPSAFRDVMTLPVAATYTITIDPRDQNIGRLTFRMEAVPDNAGATAIGQPTGVTTRTIGENAVRTFAATAGRNVTLFVSDNTIPGADLTILQPNGAIVGRLFVSGPGAFRDVMTLPVAGTYTITVDPRDQNIGSLTFRMEAVPDNAGATAIGQRTDITIGTIGENAVRTFAATAGQKVTLSVSGNTIAGVDLTIRQPSGAVVGRLFVSGPSGSSGALTLPVTDTYTLTIDPRDQNTGRLTFTLSAPIAAVPVPPGSRALRADWGAWARETAAEVGTEPPPDPADGPPVLQLTVAQVLANDRPGPANESHQNLTVTAVHTTANSHGTATLASGVITYTPNASYVGPASFTYTVCDDGTTKGQPDPRCSDGVITVKVTANKPPAVVPQQKGTQEDVPIAITLAAADPDGDPVVFRITDEPAHGTLTGTAPNLTYTPAPDFHGTDSFRFAANDRKDESAPAAVEITVSEVNDVPSAQPDSITGGVGKTAAVAATTLLRNDSPGPFDERGQTLTVTTVTPTADTHGTITFADGAVTYAPEAGFSGTAKALYTACDDGTTGGQADPRCATGPLSIVANQAPTATARSASTQRNTAVTVPLAGSDAENDVLSFAVAAAPAHGTLSGTGDTRVYAPEAGFAGADSFTFTVADAYTTSAPATVSIDVAATPPPVIRPDAAATTTNTPVLIDVLANDAAAAGSLDPATLAVSAPPAHGTASVADGRIRYTPAGDVAPDDRFTYQVCDTFGVCGRAQVTVSAVVPNRPPVAAADSYPVDTGATLDVAAPGLLGNDSDPDPGDALQARRTTGVSAGNLLFRSDGSFRYTPGPGFAGNDSFTYVVVDRAGLTSAPVTVTIDVVPPGPLAVDDSYATTKDNPLTVMPSGVLANDRDVHSTDILTARVERRPFRGDVDLNPDGSFVYTPEPGFVGADTFRYVTVNVPGVASAPAIVTIQVGAPACAPPTVDRVTPADGSQVTAPTAVTASIVPPPGETIAEWKVIARNQDRGTPIVLASGTGAPPAPLSTFDPTALVNGAYQILVSARASGGCTATAAANVFVAGEMKLGDYQTTFLDLETSIAGFPLQVLRTYDTTDTRLGDFGVGWRVELSGFRATPNNRLGQGGWTTETFGSPFTRFRFNSTIPHFVTVTEPGGRVEIFDFVPAPSGPLLSLTTPEFVARPGTGTTSRLEDVDRPVLSLAGTSVATFLGGALYDPRLFRLTTADGLVLIIDRFEGLKSATDRNGNQLIVSADGVSSPSTDRQLRFARDGAGRVTEIDAPGGKRTTYTYSRAGDLATFTGVNGSSDSFSYDGKHRLLTMDGPGGKRLRTLTYGPDGRFTSLTDAQGNTVSLSSDVDAGSEVETSPSGRLTTLSTYGPDGNLASTEEVFNAHSRATRYEYDSEGRPTRTISPLGRTALVVHDAAGNVTSYTTPKGEKWTFSYNALNLPTTTTAPDGTVIESNTYDANGNLTSTTLADGSTVTRTYDGEGRLQTETDDFGTTRYTYDDDDQLRTETDPVGRTTRYGYDTGGRLSSVENAAGERTELTWSPLGDLTRAIAADGSTQTFGYDEFGRLSVRTDPANRATRYRYDAEGRLAGMVDRTGRTTIFTYDEDGNLATVAHPDGDTTTIKSDPVGRRIEIGDADTIVERTYNDADDLLTERARGKPGVALPDVTISYTTDPNGNVTQLAGTGGTVEYGYDGRARLSTVLDDRAGTFSLAYNGADQLTALSRPNGVDDALAYRDGNLTARNASRGGSVVNRAEYALDASRRRVSLTDTDGTHDFTYDAVGRLLSARHPQASALASESFTYDRVGNRTSWAGSPPQTVRYDAAQQLLSDGDYEYSYDDEGRLVQRRERATAGITRYGWNGAGRLTSVTAPDGRAMTYRYDALGRRVEANDGGAIRRYAYSGDSLRLEYDGTNTLRAAYVTGVYPDTLFEVVRDGTPYYPLFDGLGSVTAFTGSAGDVVGRVRYSAFGIPHATGTFDQGFTFTGHQFDSATALIYARSRYYDPALGRFISQDPEPSTNPYVYCLNAPFEYTDPSGREAQTEKVKVDCEVAWRALGGASYLKKIKTLRAASRAGKLNVTRGTRTSQCRSGQRAFRNARGLASGLDADHIIDLILGGACALSAINLQALDSGINRSIGAQLGGQLRDSATGVRVKIVFGKGCP